MKWFWMVRVHNRDGMYWHGQIETGRELREIDTIADFYFALTGCKMLIEGMSEVAFVNISAIGDAFAGLWVKEPKS